MGRVTTEAIIENLGDLYEQQKGIIPSEQVRQLTVPDALADTGATSLALPTSLIQQLGLTKQGERRVRTGTGTAMVPVYAAVRLTIMGRNMSIDPIEIPDGSPVLVGQIPLEMLDLVVDPRGQKLIGNPAHGGEHTLELY
jgi:predicted aspartyl protease